MRSRTSMLRFVTTILVVVLMGSMLTARTSFAHDGYGHVYGTIFDENGQPMKAKIALTYYFSAGRYYREVQTGDDGAYAFDGIPIDISSGPQSATLGVTEAGYEYAGRLVELLPGVYIRQDIYMVPLSGHLTAKVTDNGGHPILAGFQVTGENKNLTGSTDQYGVAYLSGFPTGEYQVRAYVPGYAAETKTVSITIGEITTVDFALVPQDGAVITGTVFEKDSQPVVTLGGLEVNIWSVDPQNRLKDKWVTTTDEFGVYKSLPLLPGKYYVVAAYLEGYASYGEYLTVTAGETKRHDITPTSIAGTVMGQVLDSRQQPIPGTYVIIGATAQRSYQAEIGPDGKFKVDRVLAGPITVYAGAQYYESKTVTTTLAARGSTQVSFVLHQVVGHLTGTVTDNGTQGMPVAGAWVVVQGKKGEQRITQTAADGSFTANNLYPDVFTITVTADGYTQASNTVTISAEKSVRTSIKLVPTQGTVAGTVTGMTAKLSGVHLTLTSGGGQIVGSADTGPDGAFRIQKISPGTYQLAAELNGYRTEVVKNVTVTKGTVKNVPVTLHAEWGNVRGKVTDAHGSHPVLANVAVTLRNAANQTIDAAVTGAEGTYQFAKLSPGRYTVTATLEEYEVRQADVTVTADKVTTGDISMAWLYGGVAGAVTDVLSRKALPGVTVSLVDVSGQAAAQATTGSDGKFIMARVPVGTYSLTFDRQDYRHEIRIGVKVASSAATPVSATLAPTRGTIVGKVVDSKTQKALAGVAVTATDAAGAAIATIVTDAKGTYAILNVTEGTYSLDLRLDGYRDAKLTAVKVKGGKSMTANSSLVTSRGTVSGRVTNGKTAKAISGATVTLRNSAQEVVATATTTATGTYSFKDVTEGSYALSVEVDRFVPAAPLTLQVAGGKNTTLDVKLQPR